GVEGLEVADVVAFGAVGAGVRVVVAWAEVVEAGVVIGQEVPDDDEDRASDGDDGFLVAAAAGDAVVALAQEGVGAAGGDGGFAEDPGQVGVAVAGGGGAFLAAGGLLHAGGAPGPGGQTPRRGKPAPVQPHPP